MEPLLSERQKKKIQKQAGLGTGIPPIQHNSHSSMACF